MPLSKKEKLELVEDSCNGEKEFIIGTNGDLTIRNGYYESAYAAPCEIQTVTIKGDSELGGMMSTYNRLWQGIPQKRGTMYAQVRSRLDQQVFAQTDIIGSTLPAIAIDYDGQGRSADAIAVLNLAEYLSIRNGGGCN